MLLFEALIQMSWHNSRTKAALPCREPRANWRIWVLCNLPVLLFISLDAAHARLMHGTAWTTQTSLLSADMMIFITQFGRSQLGLKAWCTSCKASFSSAAEAMMHYYVSTVNQRGQMVRGTSLKANWIKKICLFKHILLIGNYLMPQKWG